jgi:hypothetical protein
LSQENGLGEVCRPQICSPKVGAEQVGQAKIRALKVGPDEAGAAKVRATQIGSPKAPAREVGAPEVGAGAGPRAVTQDTTDPLQQRSDLGMLSGNVEGDQVFRGCSGQEPDVPALPASALSQISFRQAIAGFLQIPHDLVE